MNENSMRESLLRQQTAASVETELNALRQLVESENRRCRRLTKWTLAVWCAWFLSVFLMFALPVLLAREPGAAAPAAPAAHAEGMLDKALQAIALVAVFAMLLSAVALPAVGIVLLVMQFFARRSATLSQLRASVAGIEAQLRLLASTRGPLPSEADG
jgi:hypothetical protein